ncbi:unnamed protein product [Lota lota]
MHTPSAVAKDLEGYSERQRLTCSLGYQTAVIDGGPACLVNLSSVPLDRKPSAPLAPLAPLALYRHVRADASGTSDLTDGAEQKGVTALGVNMRVPERPGLLVIPFEDPILITPVNTDALCGWASSATVTALFPTQEESSGCLLMAANPMGCRLSGQAPCEVFS